MFGFSLEILVLDENRGKDGKWSEPYLTYGERSRTALDEGIRQK